MTTMGPTLCMSCQRLIRQDNLGPLESTQICEAFPDGIPMDIWPEGGDHRQPVEGDNGLLYQADSQKSALFDVWEALRTVA